MRVIPVTPTRVDIFADSSVAITLPGGPMPAGFEYFVIDNLGTFATTPCVVTGPIDGGTSVSLSTAYQMRRFVFNGPNWI